ncbi:MAG: Kef-type K+ transport system membrane component KefB [Candidatus Nanohaloarchaea archaeon]|jgi:Kef-type K+ transport system membrane component KefB
MIPEATIAYDFALVILTATILGFLARKTNQPTIIAYIATGLVLGPVMFNVIGESELVSLMSELGLALLLFLLGIEMKIDDIREILRPVINIAVLQTVLQTALAFVIPLMLGFSMQETIIIALCTVFGATPVIVKLLTDKDEASTLPGKIDIGVLILQDIYLVVILALFSSGTLGNPAQIGFTLGKILVLMSAVGALSLVSSRYILPVLFSRVANNKHAFFIHGLAWAFLFISLTAELNLSIEVGAFLAGLGLGQIPYREELKERIRPITDFFMVIFFSSIGLSLTASNLLTYWLEAVIASVLLMIGNFLIMFYLIDRENFTPETSFLGSLNMTQVSEFSLVVGAIAVTQGYIQGDILGYLSMMALITMTASSYLINYNQEIYNRVKHLLERFESEEKKDVEMRIYQDHAVIVGYNAVVERILPVIKQSYGDVIVVDRDPRNTGKLGQANFEYIYGDFNHGEIRKATGIKDAGFVLSVARDMKVNQHILRDTDRDTPVFLEAESFEEAAELYDRGAEYVMIENIVTADKISDYLELYIKDPMLFKEEMDDDLEAIYWGDRSGQE